MIFHAARPYAHPHSGCQKSLRKSLLPLGLHSRSWLFGTSSGKAVLQPEVVVPIRLEMSNSLLMEFIQISLPFCQCLIGIDWPWFTWTVILMHVVSSIHCAVMFLVRWCKKTTRCRSQMTSAKISGFFTPSPPCQHFGPICSTKITQPPLLH